MGVFRKLLFIGHILVLLLLLGASLNAYIPPSKFAFLNLLSLIFPILLIVHAIFTLFWLISRRNRAFVFLIGSIFLISPVQRWLNYTSSSSENADVKVMTYNTKTIEPEKTEFLNQQQVDVLLLQESGWGEGKRYELSNFKHRANSEIVSIYSKFPILSQKHVSTSSIGHALCADIAVRDKVIRFITVYLEPFQLTKDMIKPTYELAENENKFSALLKKFLPVFKIHQNQIHEIKKLITESPYPVVLGGDFNAMPSSYEYYQISESLTDAFVEAGNGSATSFHDYKFPIRIDYVFSSKSLKAVKYFVNREIGYSDHFPVFADFHFEK